MNGSNKFVNSLKKLGFSERQAKVYSALLEKKDASLTDLQKVSGVPHNKVSEVVNYLLREGYCSEKKIGNRKYFNIVSPKSSFNRILKSMEENLTESHNITNEMEEIYNNSDKIKEPFEYIEVFHGNDNIHYHYCELVKISKKEILSFTREPFAFHTPEQKKVQEKVITDFLYRKGNVKTIYEKEFIMNYPDFFAEAENETAKYEIRVTDNLPLKMFIFDSKTLLIADAAPLNIYNELRVAIIKQQTIINAFAELFKFFWQQSIDIKVWKRQTENMQNKE